MRDCRVKDCSNKKQSWWLLDWRKCGLFVCLQIICRICELTIISEGPHQVYIPGYDPLSDSSDDITSLFRLKQTVVAIHISTETHSQNCDCKGLRTHSSQREVTWRIIESNTRNTESCREFLLSRDWLGMKVKMLNCPNYQPDFTHFPGLYNKMQVEEHFR